MQSIDEFNKVFSNKVIWFHTNDRSFWEWYNAPIEWQKQTILCYEMFEHIILVALF